MTDTAIVSAHIYLDNDGSKDIEILSMVDTDNNRTGIFDDIEYALIDEIEPNFCDNHNDYYFMAIVTSEFTETQTMDGTDYDVEHKVLEIKSPEDINVFL